MPRCHAAHWHIAYPTQFLNADFRTLSSTILRSKPIGYHLAPDSSGLSCPVTRCRAALSATRYTQQRRIFVSFFVYVFNDMRPFPILLKLKILVAVFERDDMVRVVRKCGWERHDKLDCYSASNDDHTETICQCFSDACNGADTSSFSSYKIFTALLVALTVSLRRSLQTPFSIIP